MNPTDDIQVVVKIYNGKSITIDVEEKATIQDIKNAIYAEKNIKSELQTLLFQHSILEDNQTLQHYGIETQSPPIDLVKADDQLKQFLQENNLPQYDNLYHILIQQNISYAALQYLSQKHIEDICNNNSIDTGTTIKLRTVIDNHQKNIIKEKEQKFDHEMSVVLIGDSEVGKTCLMHRFVANTYRDHMLRTFGVGSKLVHYLTLHNTSVMKITIWDTAGQERYHSLTSRHYRKGDVILYCYDTSKSTSLDNCSIWLKAIEEHAKENVFIEVIGCKSDAVIDEKLKPNVAEKILNSKQWQKYTVEHVECSSKTGQNIDNVFITAAEMVLNDIRGGNDKEIKINKLYAELQELLNQNDFDLDSLRKDMKFNVDEVDDFCELMKFNVVQKTKFRKLMRLLHSSDNDGMIMKTEQVPVETELAKRMKKNMLKTDEEVRMDVKKKKECFASDSFVIAYPNYMQKQVSDLKIYDKILTYDPIENKYIWDELLIKEHFEKNEYLNNELVSMIEFTLKNSETLTMTSNHLLYVSHDNDELKLKCADTVGIGDKLLHFDKNEIEVISIKKNVMKYPRNLLTFNGNLVVNGFAISSFCDTIKGENIYFGKTVRYILNNYYQWNVIRYPMYCISKFWTQYIPFNIKQYLYEFSID